MMQELILLVNGPGELYTWARPLIEKLRIDFPDLRIALGLLPCPFASGFEQSAAKLMGANAVASVAETLEFIAGGRKPKAFVAAAAGLVLGLGGDVAFPGRVANRLGYAAWRYSFEPYWHSSLQRLLVHDERTLQKASAPGRNVEMIGNLTADALRPSADIKKLMGLDVLFVPGSRSFQFTHMLPMFAAVAENIAMALPEVRFFCARSSLVTETDFQVALENTQMQEFGGLALQQFGDYLQTANGTRIRLLEGDERYGQMRGSDLAITIPGTNTLELGISGLASIVCLPLQKMELFPIENPLRYLATLPLVGKALKRNLVRAYLGQFKFVSLPNMLADEEIFLELRGNLLPQHISQAAIELLNDSAKRERIQQRLLQTMPKPGTAQKLTTMIASHLGIVVGNKKVKSEL